MVPADHQTCHQHFPHWASEQGFKKVVLCSPNAIQKIAAERYGKVIIPMGREDWDLSEPCPIKNVDLIVACNVFHYSPDPDLWFKNVLAACRFFYLQDLFARHRGGRRELGDDNDRTRFSIGDVHVNGEGKRFELFSLGDRVEEVILYDAGSYNERRAMINFVARIRGDLA